jgi:hypothetical protein
MINIPNNKEVPTRETNAEPLISVSEANMAIYPDRIVCYTRKSEKSLSAVGTTILSVADTDQTDRVVLFKSDLAFKIDEKKKKISMIKINNERIELEFTI